MESQSAVTLAAIDRLVFQQHDPVVVALTGGWGEGKTYFWLKSVVRKHQSKKPGYISVFGAESLAVIRERVAMAGIGIAESGETSLEAKWREAGASVLGTLRKAWNFWGEKIGVSDSIAVDLLQSFGLKPGWVLCIDDVERLAESIGLDAFLGYVAELRDRRAIKVVLIFNRGLIERDKVFHLYREKVIDREIPFGLDLAEVVKLVFCDVKIPKFDAVSEAREKAEILSLRNIRILVKARNYFTELVGELPDLGSVDFIKAAFNSLLLFAYTKFSGDKPAELTFDALQQHNDWTDRFRLAAGLRDAEPDDAPNPAKALLEKYQYSVTDDLDRFLMNFVESDVLNVERLKELYAIHRQEADKAGLAKRFRGVWDAKYHGTFADNAEVLATDLEAALAPYLRYVPPNELDFALIVLNVLGRPEVAGRFFEEFKTLRGHTFERLDEGSMPIRSFDYPPLKQYFDEIAQRGRSDTRSIQEVLAGAFKDSFLQRRDAERLATFSVDELVHYFMTQEQPMLTSKLRMLARDGANNGLREKVLAVAQRIAATGPLNALRLEGMGLLPRREPGNEVRESEDG